MNPTDDSWVVESGRAAVLMVQATEYRQGDHIFNRSALP